MKLINVKCISHNISNCCFFCCSSVMEKLKAPSQVLTNYQDHNKSYLCCFLGFSDKLFSKRVSFISKLYTVLFCHLESKSITPACHVRQWKPKNECLTCKFRHSTAMLKLYNYFVAILLFFRFDFFFFFTLCCDNALLMVWFIRWPRGVRPNTKATKQKPQQK